MVGNTATSIGTLSGYKICYFAVDAAGNRQSVVNSAIYTLDTTYPYISYAGNLYTNSGGVISLSWSGTKATLNGGLADAYDIRLGNDVAFGSGTAITTNSSATGYISSTNVVSTISGALLATGSTALHIFVTDGDYTGTASLLVYRDDEAPVNDIFTINSGSTYATGRTVSLALSGSDNLGIYQFCASEDPIVCTSWQTYTTPAAYTIGSAGDGSKTIYVRIRDAAGNISAATTSTGILLDTTIGVPTGTDDVTFTTSKYVSLYASDVNDSIYYTTDGSTPIAGNTGTLLYASGFSVTVTTVVKAIATDIAGNISDVMTHTYTKYTQSN